MRLYRVFQRLTFLLIFLVGGIVTYTAYIAISNIVAEQSRIQQQAVSPVFSLVNEQLLMPLHIADTLGRADYFTDLLAADEIDEAAISERLSALSDNFSLSFFAASEKARKQYFSNRAPIDLIEGKVFWYFEAKAQPKDFFADLGQVGDVHLFFDVKIYDDAGQFVGIVGLGKSLEAFLNIFDQYKARYGYDFLFVNENNEIILTSLSDLVVTDAHIPVLSELPWAKNFKFGDDLTSQLVSKDDDDFLVSEIRIDELKWKLLLLIPLEARQAQITKTFVTNTVEMVVLVVALFGLTFWLMWWYRRRIDGAVNLDPLSGLPNRNYVHRRYRQIQRSKLPVSVVMVDIDHFKKINDTHGHNVGDRVIKAVADTLVAQLRRQDLAGRWGGEEYLLLIPGEGMDTAVEIAHRAKTEVEKLKIQHGDISLTVTASFGVASGSSRRSLAELVAKADKALYQAKASGRNQVVESQA